MLVGGGSFDLNKAIRKREVDQADNQAKSSPGRVRACAKVLRQNLCKPVLGLFKEEPGDWCGWGWMSQEQREGKGRRQRGKRSESLRIPDARIELGVRPVYPDP